MATGRPTILNIDRSLRPSPTAISSRGSIPWVLANCRTPWALSMPVSTKLTYQKVPSGLVESSVVVSSDASLLAMDLANLSSPALAAMMVTAHSLKPSLVLTIRPFSTA